MSEENNVVDLAEKRRQSLVEKVEGFPMACMEIVWGERACYFHGLTVDMEAYRRGARDLEMRPPQTDYEVELVVRHLRSVANDIAREGKLPHLVHPGDDFEPPDGT